MQCLTPSLEIQMYLEKIDREQSYIENRCCEVDQAVNSLEREKIDLLDRYGDLDTAKEICYRALAGEPVAIWAELQRYGF